MRNNSASGKYVDRSDNQAPNNDEKTEVKTGEVF